MGEHPFATLGPGSERVARGLCFSRVPEKGHRLLRRGEDTYLQSERRRRANTAWPISLSPCETLSVGLRTAGWEKPRVNSASCLEGLEL